MGGGRSRMGKKKHICVLLTNSRTPKFFSSLFAFCTITPGINTIMKLRNDIEYKLI